MVDALESNNFVPSHGVHLELPFLLEGRRWGGVGVHSTDGILPVVDVGDESCEEKDVDWRAGGPIHQLRDGGRKL